MVPSRSPDFQIDWYRQFGYQPTCRGCFDFNRDISARKRRVNRRPAVGLVHAAKKRPRLGSRSTSAARPNCRWTTNSVAARRLFGVSRSPRRLGLGLALALFGCQSIAFRLGELVELAVPQPHHQLQPAPAIGSLAGPLGTAVGAVNRGPAVVSDPHYVARGATVEIDGVHVPASPVRLRDPEGPRSATATTPPAPLGADTDDVLASLGYSADEIAAFRADGVIG